MTDHSIDLTTLTDTICGEYWDARQMIHGLGPWVGTDKQTQNTVKEDALPWVVRSVGPILDAYTNNLKVMVTQLDESDLSDSEKLMLLLDALGVRE